MSRHLATFWFTHPMPHDARVPDCHSATMPQCHNATVPQQSLKIATTVSLHLKVTPATTQGNNFHILELTSNLQSGSLQRPPSFPYSFCLSSQASVWLQWSKLLKQQFFTNISQIFLENFISFEYFFCILLLFFFLTSSLIHGIRILFILLDVLMIQASTREIQISNLKPQAGAGNIIRSHRRQRGSEENTSDTNDKGSEETSSQASKLR